jgi:hypothetical protein
VLLTTVRGRKCVASWPGIYAKQWDALVAKSKADSISAAVVFLPEMTLDFGRHGSDKCYCVDMYGEVKPWGCKVPPTHTTPPPHKCAHPSTQPTPMHVPCSFHTPTFNAFAARLLLY